jgi:hypothetical protein
MYPSLKLLPIALTLSFATHAAELYRYTNEEGNTVIDYRVPDQYIANGYEVLSEDGVVLRVVPRELTDEEKAAWANQAAENRAAEVDRERLRQWDESLLLRYSSTEDIEDARNRALRDLRIRLSILKSNKRSLKLQIENHQRQAADLERSGLAVPPQLTEAISDAQSQIRVTERSIVEREREIDKVSTSFQRDIDRFVQLQDLVELRRSFSQSGPVN